MYSFDVFDTLITRTTAIPQGIFALIKDRLEEESDSNGLDEYIIHNFFELRVHSEELARKACYMQNVEEVNLYDIYCAMAVCGCLNQSQIEYLCNLEENIEIENVTGIAENICRLKEILFRGEKVILISDMYLSENTIRKMLLKADLVFKEIPLYVSSEYRKRKTTGNLYRIVKELAEADYDHWIHIGDNMFQDIEIPYNLGIQVELVSKPEMSHFEKESLKKYGGDSRLQLMIGSAIYSEHHQKEQQDDDLRSLAAYHSGCRYAGPVLYCYAEWIVKQAERKNINRLYFIARDGYLIKKIVDIIIVKKEINIKTYYIYGSRKAWRIPALSEEHYNLYQLMIWSHTNKIRTLKDLAEVIHVSLKDLYQFLPGTLGKNEINRQITNVELEYIADWLSRNEKFRDWHLKELKGEKKYVQQYLYQELDLSDDRFAFVDVAGGGLTQGSLREIIKDRYQKPIHTFFFKIDRINLAENSITDTFMPSFLPNDLTIEMMCRAPHGQTKCYRKEGENIVPILEAEESKALDEHGFNNYEKGIMNFSIRMCEVAEQCKKQIGSMRNIILYLHHIAEEPSKEVLDYFATVPSSDSGRDEEIREYAPRLTEQDIKNIFLRHTAEPLENYYKGSNLNYSILRASEEEKELIEECQKKYHSTVGKLFRQEKEREYKELRERFGRAAFYPTDLLEEKVVLYGAGKFGRDLYRRLQMDKKHEVVLWVDKKAESYQKQGLTSVHHVFEINRTEYDQIVIAVMAKELAHKIGEELISYGLKAEKIVWIWPYNPVNPRDVWKTEKIG